LSCKNKILRTDYINILLNLYFLYFVFKLLIIINKSLSIYPLFALASFYLRFLFFKEQKQEINPTPTPPIPPLQRSLWERDSYGIGRDKGRGGDKGAKS